MKEELPFSKHMPFFSTERLQILIAPHKQKSIVKKIFWQEDAPPPWPPKHNGKSSTVDVRYGNKIYHQKVALG
jgi:hypothetical protein